MIDVRIIHAFHRQSAQIHFRLIGDMFYPYEFCHLGGVVFIHQLNLSSFFTPVWFILF